MYCTYMQPFAIYKYIIYIDLDFKFLLLLIALFEQRKCTCNDSRLGYLSEVVVILDYSTLNINIKAYVFIRQSLDVKNTPSPCPKYNNKIIS